MDSHILSMSALSWQVESTWKLRDLDVLRLQRKQRPLLFERVLYMLVLMLQVREERPGDWNFIIPLILEDCPVLGVPGRAVLYCNFSYFLIVDFDSDCLQVEATKPLFPPAKGHQGWSIHVEVFVSVCGLTQQWSMHGICRWCWRQVEELLRLKRRQRVLPVFRHFSWSWVMWREECKACSWEDLHSGAYVQGNGKMGGSFAGKKHDAKKATIGWNLCSQKDDTSFWCDMLNQQKIQQLCEADAIRTASRDNPSCSSDYFLVYSKWFHLAKVCQATAKSAWPRLWISFMLWLFHFATTNCETTFGVTLETKAWGFPFVGAAAPGLMLYACDQISKK